MYNRETLNAYLVNVAEPDYAKFSSALIPGLTRPLLGVRIPILRKLAKIMAKEDGEKALSEVLVSDTFEVVILRGFLIGYMRTDWKITWKEICNFVPYIDNWLVCDCCCSSFKLVRAHKEEVWPFLLNYIRSDKEYEQRFAVVMMMYYFLTEDYIDRVLAAWSSMHPAGYYAEMAVGWGLSVSFFSFYEKTMSVLMDECVSLVCRKKACQKILESRRTPLDLKNIIKDLKSKY